MPLLLFNAIITHFTIIVAILIVIRLFIFGLKSTFCMVLTLGAESSLGLAHFVELCIVLVVGIVFEDLVFLVLQVLILQLLNHLFLLGAPLAIFKIVHVELIL